MRRAMSRTEIGAAKEKLLIARPPLACVHAQTGRAERALLRAGKIKMPSPISNREHDTRNTRQISPCSCARGCGGLAWFGMADRQKFVGFIDIEDFGFVFRRRDG